MKVTVTARCSFCARTFNAVDPAVMANMGSIRVVDGIVCEDAGGRLCCDSCMCFACGIGHVRDGDECESCEQAALDEMTFDADAFRDWAMDTAAGVI